jgi:hypothetical protein
MINHVLVDGVLVYSALGGAPISAASKDRRELVAVLIISGSSTLGVSTPSCTAVVHSVTLGHD